jgi:serine phosphatase RsbU (regulator of sigma subunit)
VAVGDVCGKGEEAAAVTAAARYAIRVLARRCADPGEVLAGANEIVLAEEFALDGGFVTANIAHLTWLDGKLRVVIGSAGHPAAVLLRADGRVRMMNGGGLPLGLFPDAAPTTQELAMEAGDMLFLYTDGVAQARGPNNTYFQDRLADELTGLTGSTPGQLVASMRQAMLDFSGGNLIDDVTMLVVRADRMTGDAQLSLLLELELLYLGIEGKHTLWRTLRVLPDSRLSGFDFEKLAHRAQEQLAAVEEQRLAVAPAALAG